MGDQAAAIAAMEEAFGRLIRQRVVEGRWIVWRSIHKRAALAARVSDAERRGARGVFLRVEARETVVGCLNPAYREG